MLAQPRTLIPENGDESTEVPVAEKGLEFFEVTGLRVTCLSRSFFIPIGKVDKDVAKITGSSMEIEPLVLEKPVAVDE